MYMCVYSLDDVLEDFLFSELTVYSLETLKFFHHFSFSPHITWNVQFRFLCQIHKIISVLQTAIGEALDFVYVGRVTYNLAFKKVKKYSKMPRYFNFWPIWDLVTLNIFVFKAIFSK